MESLYLIELVEQIENMSKLTIKAKVIGVETGAIKWYDLKDLCEKLKNNEIFLENCLYDNKKHIKVTMGELIDYKISTEKILLIEEIQDLSGKVIGYKYCTSSGKIFEESLERIYKLAKKYHFINMDDKTFEIRGKKLNYHTEYDMDTYCKIIIKRLNLLADKLNNDEELSLHTVKYSVLRSIIVDAATKGFKSTNKNYKANQGIYKHTDGSTTLIDLDGFFTDECNGIYTTEVSQCLRELSYYMERYIKGEALPINGITDSECNIKRLATCSVEQFLECNIVPINIVYKTDKEKVKTIDNSGIDSSICSEMLLKPIYKDELELSYILNKIYTEVFSKARQCTL